MKSNFTVVSVFAALCILTSCSKSSSDDNPTPSGPVIDSSTCVLSDVAYDSKANMPYYSDPLSITFDSLKRVASISYYSAFNKYFYEPGKITRRSYINSIVDSNLINVSVFTLNNNNQVVSQTEAFYMKPKSETDFRRQDKIEYEYDAEGYLIYTRMYAFGTKIYKEVKYTYQNGNMVQRENFHYDYLMNPGTKLGGDTITYTYDNTPWMPEAVFLYEVSDSKDIIIGKPNKNNITGIQLKMYDQSTTGINFYKTINYTYYKKGSKVERVGVSATTTKGYVLDYNISFKHKCDYKQP